MSLSATGSDLRCPCSVTSRAGARRNSSPSRVRCAWVWRAVALLRPLGCLALPGAELRAAGCQLQAVHCQLGEEAWSRHSSLQTGWVLTGHPVGKSINSIIVLVKSVSWCVSPWQVPAEQV